MFTKLYMFLPPTGLLDVIRSLICTSMKVFVLSITLLSLIEIGQDISEKMPENKMNWA